MKIRFVIFGFLALTALAVFMLWAPGVENLPQKGPLEGYTRDATHIYVLGPQKEIHGTGYTIPSTLADGTNLAHDTYISYEESDLVTCEPKDFLDGVTEVKDVTDDGVAYRVANAVGAGAGNRYDETVYVFKDYTPCTAVRYYIHYGAIENYPEGTVKEFDRAALVSAFDTIRRSLAKSR